MLKIEEAQWQNTVVEAATTRGWLAYHTYDSRRSHPGFPDLVLVRGIRLIFAELKTEVGTESAAQETWLERLAVVAAERGIEVYLWRPVDWPEVDAALR